MQGKMIYFNPVVPSGCSGKVKGKQDGLLGQAASYPRDASSTDLPWGCLTQSS